VTDELVRRARDVMRHAHAPYSGFHVGAAIEAGDGTIHVGCNVESASYGLTICAERMALGAAVAAGATRITRVVVTTDVDPPAAPCGACRQLLAEFGLTMEIRAVGPTTERRWSLSALLPDAFTRETLER
jgi:cytidine deaminase